MLKKTTVHVDAETRAAAKFLARQMPAVPANRYFGVVVRSAILEMAKQKGWKVKPPAPAVTLTDGERLGRARKAANLSQEELAQRLGIARPTVSHAESGKNPVAGRLASWLEEQEGATS